MADVEGLEALVNEARARLTQAPDGRLMAVAAYDGITSLLLAVVEELRDLRTVVDPDNDPDQ